MPPRDRSSSRNRDRNRGRNNYQENYYNRRNPYGNSGTGNEPLIPKEYAEDVEFIETKDYSSTESRINSNVKQESFHESQISDAEWTEIKKSTSK